MSKRWVINADESMSSHPNGSRDIADFGSPMAKSGQIHS